MNLFPSDELIACQGEQKPEEAKLAHRSFGTRVQ